MNEGRVARYMKAATHDMIRNNQTEIKCPCHKCKLKCYIDPYSGQLQSHLLYRGFMDGYTRWISDEDDDNVHGAAMENDEEGHGGDEDDDNVNARSTHLPCSVQPEASYCMRFLLFKVH
jgi:hypothetical protein